MVTPPQPRTSPKWPWVAVLVIFVVLTLAVVFNPSGDRDGTVQDPIVINDVGEGNGVGQVNEADEASSAPAPEPFAPGGQPASSQ